MKVAAVGPLLKKCIPVGLGFGVWTWGSGGLRKPVDVEDKLGQNKALLDCRVAVKELNSSHYIGNPHYLIYIYIHTHYGNLI